LDIDIYCNGGYSEDTSLSVLECGMFSIDNCYNIPIINVKTYCCITNLPSNIAFRLIYYYNV
jgi:xanthine dehydrogenase molybdopterin-binding subunit B